MVDIDAQPASGTAAPAVRVAEEVAEALERGAAVVALESTIISHGLPRPDNLEVAHRIEDAVRAGGAVPATIAVVDGVARIGLDGAALAAIAERDDVVKASVRDLGFVVARGGSAATTVAATAFLAARCGIRLFATGGLGGVHRGARESFDESADLVALARTRIAVVCSGVKSILDIGATLERLESLNVPVVGYRSDTFPAFYISNSGHRLDWRADTPREVADVIRARDALALGGQGIVVANPLPPDQQLDARLHERVLRGALAELEAKGISGKAVTPFLLEYFHRNTGGESMRANIRLVLRNAKLAARIAAALSGDGS
ncbi:MAG TPA: pseudouridine-5'-phosphate glycosidase [Actinocrinis sp.]|jgi:pseudouridine-5'-phosphate glycosidase|uniref:pseudouridine-5'-phosphate glycosidase n=1 Tax=Actinocrinis sp. TaxID=1920516 RepID=UPI002DDD2215|nr:pseudouridine-5'-phosphate glycosidase [Actinocrinis sp.]HEV3170866.1 pseudouridine-5'-phosphate glycosidase [Actinocrinis sp.]